MRKRRAIANPGALRNAQIHVEIAVYHNKGVVRHMVTYPYHGFVLRRCRMLVETETGLLEIVRQDDLQHAQKQNDAHRVETLQFAGPAQQRIQGYSGIDSGRCDQWNNVEREHLAATNEEQPEADRQQGQHQVLAVPPAIDEVKCRNSNADRNKEWIVGNPVNPACNEAAAFLTAFDLSNKGVQDAQVRLIIPGQVPGIREQFIFQDGQQDKSRAERDNCVDEGNEAKFALKFRRVQPGRVNHARQRYQEHLF